MPEFEFERTARVLKQADPGHKPPKPASNNQPPAPTGAELPAAIIAAIVAFIAILVAIAAHH